MDGHDCELTQSLLFIQFQYIYTHIQHIYIHRIKYLYMLLKETYSIMYMYILLYASFLNINAQCRHVHFFMSPPVLSHRSGKPTRPQSAQRRSRQLVGHSFFGRYEPPPKCGIKSYWLVGGLEHDFFFSSQLTNIVQRGWNHQPDG